MAPLQDSLELTGGAGRQVNAQYRRGNALDGGRLMQHKQPYKRVLLRERKRGKGRMMRLLQCKFE